MWVGRKMPIKTRLVSVDPHAAWQVGCTCLAYVCRYPSSGGEFKLFLQVASSCQRKHMCSIRRFVRMWSSSSRRGISWVCAICSASGLAAKTLCRTWPHQGQDNGPFIELQTVQIAGQMRNSIRLAEHRSTTRNSSSSSGGSIAHLLMLLKLQPRVVQYSAAAGGCVTKGSSKHNHFNLAKLAAPLSLSLS